MSVRRPLPAVPNIEFARKEAKALLRLLRLLRNADRASLDRASRSHPALAHTSPSDFRLADAQLTIAREYGFASWPRLVTYFNTAERQRFRQHTNLGSPEGLEYYAAALLKSHAKRKTRDGRTLAEYVPRFFGLPLEEVFAATVSEDEARHACARAVGFPSWDVMIEKSTEVTKDRPPGHTDAWSVDVSGLARRALRTADLAALQKVVNEHPELLTPKDHVKAQGSGLLNWALYLERDLGQAAMQPILEWPVSLGFDIQQRLNEQLCGRGFTTVSEVQYLLDRGADPNWIAPNGISVLEHALIRYQSAECVDLIAKHATPPKARWIAAGLGDANGVADFLDRHGKPTAAARRKRPDFTAVGPMSWPSRTDASDDEILFETFFIAACNSRVKVLDYLVSRGFNVNSMAWEIPIVEIAADRRLIAVLECVVRHGADVDLADADGNSARSLAAMLVPRMPWDADTRRIGERCGVDVEAALNARRARKSPSLDFSPELQKVIALASDDATRMGQRIVHVEKFLHGLSRAGGAPQYWIARNGGMDFNAFRDAVLDRVRHGDACTDAPVLALDAESQEAIAAAVGLAAQRHDETAHGMHLIAVLNHAGGALEQLLMRFGGSVEQMQFTLDSCLQYDNAV